MDKIKFEAGFKALCISVGYRFTSEQERKDHLRVFYQTLSKNGFTDIIWEESVNKMILNWDTNFGRKLPTVKDFLDLNGLSVSVIAESAHKGVKNLIMSIGGYEPVSFGKKHKHNVAHAVVREMGGWYQICQNPTEWDKRKGQFIKTFERLFYDEVPVDKPLLGKSTEANARFLAEYNNNQLTSGKEER